VGRPDAYQDVESCASACAIVRPLPAGSSGFQSPIDNPCTMECEADRANATDAGREGYFQGLLTCIGNAQGFPSACDTAACEAQSTFILPPNGCGAADGGSP